MPTESKQKNKIVIGVTGGAGSGKSTVVNFVLKNFDCEFINTDLVAHDLMEPGKANYKALIKEYGEEILDPCDMPRISRPLLLKKVSESGDFAKLNSITHPNVIKRSKQIIRNTKKPVVLVEAALLLEAGMDSICDDVWFVTAPLTHRIRRMKETRGYTDERVRDMLKNQLSDEEFKKRTSYTINNPDGSDEGMKAAVGRIKELLDSKTKNK